MSLIDTHSHLYVEEFSSPTSAENSTLRQVLDQADEAGISSILLPSISFASLDQMDQLISFAQQIQSNIAFFKMAGVHPCELKKGDHFFISKINLFKIEI